MPFTFVHPIAVLPLKKWSHSLILSALIIGALSPDFGYYFPLPSFLEKDSHSLIGLFLHSLPIGGFLFLAYHLLRADFIFFLPEPHRSAMFAELEKYHLSFKFLFFLIISILLGALTHILWDAFTHKSGWFVMHSSALRYELFSITGTKYFTFNLLQHLSTFLGLAYLLYKYKKWVSRRLEKESIFSWRYIFWLSLVFVSMALSACLVFQDSVGLTFFELRKMGFLLAVRAVQIFLCILLATLIGRKLQSKLMS